METLVIKTQNNDVKMTVLCDADNFIDNWSYKETYEKLYLIVSHATSLLIDVFGAKKETLTLTLPKAIVNGFGEGIMPGQGKKYLGVYLSGKWKLYQSTEIPEDEIQIGSDVGKIVIKVANIPE